VGRRRRYRAAEHGDSKKTLKVGLAFDIGGRGDKSFNDAAAAGLDRAKSELNVEVKDLERRPTRARTTSSSGLKLLCTGGFNPVIAVGFVYAGADPKTGPLAKAANDCPDTKFAIIDDQSVTLPNVAGLVFAEEQGSFLVGVAAALKAKSGTVGFVGGCDVPLIHKFEAGFKAGAAAAQGGHQGRVELPVDAGRQVLRLQRPGKGQDGGRRACTSRVPTSCTRPRVARAPACSRPPRPRQAGDRRRLRPVQHGRRRPQGRHHHLDAQARRRRRLRVHQGQAAGSFTAGQTSSTCKGRRRLLDVRRQDRRHQVPAGRVQAEDHRRPIKVPTS
jgi:hypothetical protein